MPNSTEQPDTWADALTHTKSLVADRQEALWLVERASGLTPSELLGSSEKPTGHAWHHLARMIEQRASGHPIQHVLGQWQFRGIELAVTPQALIPRPETEQLVEWALATANESPPLSRALDLGTGSGAIALSLAVEVRDLDVWATERSPEAARLARANLAGLGGRPATRVRIVEGSWFEPLDTTMHGTFDLIVANPPYLADHELDSLDSSVRDYEPHESLFAGPTGTEDLRFIADQARVWLRSGGTLALEMSPWQTRELQEFVTSLGYAHATVHNDLEGLERCIVARLA